MRVAIILIAIAVTPILQRVTRETNSHAATARGLAQFQQQKYTESSKSFAAATAIERSAAGEYNLGTAEIAAGRTTEGAAALSRAATTPALRADALFNRGNGALASKAFEFAVRDYSDVLKLRPNDKQAKRNLEIALKRQQDMKRPQAGQQQQQGGAPQPQKQAQPGPAAKPADRGREDSNDEALLRSVQQQEQEELSRMKRARAESVRVGW